MRMRSLLQFDIRITRTEDIEYLEYFYSRTSYNENSRGIPLQFDTPPAGSFGSHSGLNE